MRPSNTPTHAPLLRLSAYLIIAILLACKPYSVAAFAPFHSPSSFKTTASCSITTLCAQKGKGKVKDFNRISQKRRNELGIPDDASEYDLDEALNQNTDPLITKIIAGSLIVVVIGLLVAGIVVPSLTDYGEGVCSPIQNGGRC